MHTPSHMHSLKEVEKKLRGSSQSIGAENNKEKKTTFYVLELSYTNIHTCVLCSVICPHCMNKNYIELNFED